jgi:hypothetical protein
VKLTATQVTRVKLTATQVTRVSPAHHDMRCPSSDRSWSLALSAVAPTGVTSPSRSATVQSATTGQSRTRTESAEAEPAARPSKRQRSAARPSKRAKSAARPSKTERSAARPPKRQRVVIEIDSSDGENEPEAQQDQPSEGIRAVNAACPWTLPHSRSPAQLHI